VTRALPIPALALALAVAPVLAACAGPPGLSARMSDAEVRAVLARDTPPGSTERDVRAALDRLEAPAHSRTVYPAEGSRPKVLLQRVFEGRGFWLHSDNDLVEFLDVSFVFTPQDTLDRALLHRDKVRYFHGEPVIFPHAPSRPLQHHPAHYPGPLPPPIDPLEDAQ
jgi:hypothetical protein